MTTPDSKQTPMYMNACPLGCKGLPEVTTILLPEGPLLRCGACGQLISQCTESEHLAALRRYDTIQGTQPDPASRARFEKVNRRRTGQILRFLRKQPAQVKLLDVGCSSGSFLLLARSMGIEVQGVEPSPKAADTAKRQGLSVFQGLLYEAHYPDRFFDGVTLIEVIEHLKDPLSLLMECRRILRPGGIAVINTPNANSWTAKFMGSKWQGFSLSVMGGHVSFFNPNSIAVLAKRTGFHTVNIETRNVRLVEKGQCPPALYHVAKVASELLNAPARLLGQGHDLLAFFRRPLE